MFEAIAREQSSEVFDFAVKTLDDKFGEGYAKRNPQLLAALVEAFTDIALSVQCAG